LRVDNADERLTRKGMDLGVVGSVRSEHFAKSREGLRLIRSQLDELTLTPKEAERHGLALNQDGIRRTAFQLLAYPDIGWDRLARIWPELSAVDSAVADRIATDATYAVYLDRQTADIAAFRRDESITLDEGIDFKALPGLSNEIKAKLDLVRPRTLGQAARIEGMTPAAITLLAAHTRKAVAGEEGRRR
jgi:tRNA uridine 5-carboxymethylaminomethyl modification enzyme